MNTYVDGRLIAASEPPCCSAVPTTKPTVYSELDRGNNLAADCFMSAGRIFASLVGSEPTDPRDPVAPSTMMQLDKLNSQLEDLRGLLINITEVLGVYNAKSNA